MTPLGRLPRMCPLCHCQTIIGDGRRLRRRTMTGTNASGSAAASDASAKGANSPASNRDQRCHRRPVRGSARAGNVSAHPTGRHHAHASRPAFQPTYQNPRRSQKPHASLRSGKDWPLKGVIRSDPQNGVPGWRLRSRPERSRSRGGRFACEHSLITTNEPGMNANQRSWTTRRHSTCDLRKLISRARWRPEAFR